MTASPTHHQATFTRRDLAIFLHRHSDGQDQFDAAMAAVRGSPEMVALGKDGRGEDRFTARAMIETERRLEVAADRLAAGRDHGLPAAANERARVEAAGSKGPVLGTEQQAALDRITRPDGLSIVLGYAGTGKSAMLGVARDAWEQAGYRVQGLALSGIAAENLEKGSGIVSRTIASLEHQWTQGRELPASRDILVIDEAGMVGSRQMERLLYQASASGTKVVLVGDPEQLQAIEAGAALRILAERHGAVEIGDVRRQREDWQRDATRWLATGRTGQALHAYDERGQVHAAATREEARAQLVERWMQGRAEQPNASQIILAHASYVALTRHRDGVELHYGQDDFADTGRLVRTLSRERAKEMAGDYLSPEQRQDHVRAFAERRGFAGIVEQVRDIFTGFRATPLEALPDVRQDREHDVERLAERYARSHFDIRRMRDVGLAPRSDQLRALEHARDALDAVRPHAAADLDRALEHRPQPMGADPSGRELVQVMREEQKLRTDPFLRADRFIQGWQQLQADRWQLERDGDARGLHKVEERMTHMARDLKDDWQVAALLLGGERADRIDMDRVRAFERGVPAEREAPDHGRGMDR